MRKLPQRIEQEFADAEKRNDLQVLTDAEVVDLLDLLVKISEAHQRKPWSDPKDADPETAALMDRADVLLEKRERGLCDA